MVKKDAHDIVNDLLESCILAYPVSSFVISLYKQYQLRGSLSKKQLEGLYGKASKIENIPPGKLATLEALIKKMPTRFKSETPVQNVTEEQFDQAADWIHMVLAKYPQHKRVLFLKSKYDNKETISKSELEDLKRLTLLLK